MNRKRKNLLIWLMFGIFLGTSIARAVGRPNEVDILDWILIVFGVIVAIIHYLPDKLEKDER